MLLLAAVILQCGKTDKDVQRSDLVSQSEEHVIKSIFHPLPGIVFDSLKIEDFLSNNPDFKGYKKEYYDFYRQRGFNYAWFDKEGIIEQSMALYNHLQEEEQDGIPVVIPHEEKLKELLHHESEHVKDSLDGERLETELMLTGQYFVYADRKIAGSGIAAPEKIDWYLPRKTVPYAELLENIVEGKDIDEVEGAVMQKQYNLLKKALTEYREMEKADTLGITEFLPKNASLKPGDTSSVIPSVKAKLAMRDMYSSEDSSLVYDNSMIPAVNAFKKTHGLQVDSIITDEMIKELNVPISHRIEQLVVNLERFRWIPPGFSHDEFIIVNIPEFRLHYYEDWKEVWDCNVVVGKPVTNTVIFSGDMQYVVMSPYWNIPSSIINKEVKPGMKRDPNYLAKHRMEWNDGRVRQLPGPANSLGRVKFLFPNSNNIYLHDTPAKRLFGEEQRAFSHGCVRVGEPRELAIRVLKQDSTWTPSKIDEAMNRSYETTVTLEKKIPVYIGYFTAFVDSNGMLNFRRDVYKRDQRLLRMITG